MSQNKITAVIGNKGRGKTTYAVRLWAEAPRALAFDPQQEWSESYPHTEDLRVFVRYCQQVENLEFFKAVFRPGVGALLRKQFDRVAEAAWHLKRCTLAVDEIDRVCSATEMPEPLDTIVQLGRKPEINLLWTTRRLAEVSMTMRSQTDEFVVFQFHEPSDLDAIRRRIGPDLAARIPTLPQFHAILWSSTEPPRYWNGNSVVDMPRGAAPETPAELPPVVEAGGEHSTLDSTASETDIPQNQ